MLGGFLIGLEYSPRVEAYDVASDTWQRLADLPIGSTYHGVAAVNGTMFSFGSMGDVWLYDFSNDSWSSRSDMPGERE